MSVLSTEVTILQNHIIVVIQDKIIFYIMKSLKIFYIRSDNLEKSLPLYLVNFCKTYTKRARLS